MIIEEPFSIHTYIHIYVWGGGGDGGESKGTSLIGQFQGACKSNWWLDWSKWAEITWTKNFCDQGAGHPRKTLKWNPPKENKMKTSPSWSVGAKGGHSDHCGWGRREAFQGSIHYLHIEYIATTMPTVLMSEWHLNNTKTTCISLSTSSKGGMGQAFWWRSTTLHVEGNQIIIKGWRILVNRDWKWEIRERNALKLVIIQM